MNSSDSHGPTPPSPRSDTPASAADTGAGTSELVVDPGKLRILVVEDESTIRKVIAQVLRMDGHEPTEAACAEEALEAFRAEPFPLLITDINMGRMNGLELLREVKRLDPECLVVIMTSQASIEAATTALREGAYDFLVKPFDDLILISALVKRAAVRLGLQRRNLLLASQLEMHVHELERLNHSLKDLADRDWLTGLYNRRYLRSALDSEISRALRQQRGFALILLDMDHFKSYNDAHGHLAGDELLRLVARSLADAGGAEHVCARYGGDEFVVLMPDADHAAATTVAERVRRAMEEHRIEAGGTQPGAAVTVSLGIACFPADSPDGDSMIACADAALYHAKKNGRNQVRGVAHA